MLRSPMRCIVVLCVLAAAVATAAGQSATSRPKKLPSAEEIVDNYLKAIGGKKTAAAQKVATHEWNVQHNNHPVGTARTVRKSPASHHFELTFAHGQTVSGA